MSSTPNYRYLQDDWKGSHILGTELIILVVFLIILYSLSVIMANLDETDRRLIAALKRDGRASITTLAHDLDVSRSTVQSRLDRLIRSGTIQRFTVELDAMGSDDRVHAVMMIAVEGPRARQVIRALRRLPEITALHTTNGKWDLIGWIETGTLAEFDRVLREVREVPGVLNSETCLLLDAAKS